MYEISSTSKQELQPTNALGAPAPRFDYKAPEHVEHYTRLTLARDAIRKEMGRCAKSIIKIGLHLIDVKEDVGHGLFLKWLDAEFGWSDQTARNFMHVAERFSDEPNSKRILNLEPTTIYLLAAPKTPEEVREDVLSRIDAGETISVKEIRDRLRQSKGSVQTRSNATDLLGRIKRDILHLPTEELEQLKDWLRGNVIVPDPAPAELTRQTGSEAEPEPVSEHKEIEEPERVERIPLDKVEDPKQEAPKVTAPEPEQREPKLPGPDGASLRVFQQHAAAAGTPWMGPAEPQKPMKTREQTIKAFKRCGELGPWQMEQMRIDDDAVDQLVAEGILEEISDRRVRYVGEMEKAA